MKNIILFFIMMCFGIVTVKAQDKFAELRTELSSVIAPFQGTVGIAMIDLQNNDTLTVHNSIHFPMMSVYKLPQAIAVLHEIDKGTLSLHEKIRITKDMLDNFTWSPLKEQHPGDTLELTIKELIGYTISYSDNLACDVLFERLGGTKNVHHFIQKSGFPHIIIQNTEREMGKDNSLIYQNSSTPFEMCRLLKKLYEKELLSDSSTAFLFECMTTNYTSSARLKGLLSSAHTVAHKTGTNVSDSLVYTCNDVGIISFPHGKRLAISVFTMNAKETYKASEEIIAKISKSIDNFYGKTK